MDPMGNALTGGISIDLDGFFTPNYKALGQETLIFTHLKTKLQKFQKLDSIVRSIPVLCFFMSFDDAKLSYFNEANFGPDSLTLQKTSRGRKIKSLYEENRRRTY